MLKEYEFMVRKSDGKGLEAPMEHALNIVDGGSLTVELVGQRVAFSAFGEVSLLFFSK